MMVSPRLRYGSMPMSRLHNITFKYLILYNMRWKVYFKCIVANKILYLVRCLSKPVPSLIGELIFPRRCFNYHMACRGITCLKEKYVHFSHYPQALVQGHRSPCLLSKRIRVMNVGTALVINEAIVDDHIGHFTSFLVRSDLLYEGKCISICSPLMGREE